ncbi:MAG: hypothetical protein WBX22_27730 [Silvibacterium sp.]
MDLKSLVSALPTAASSPLAFAAYVLVIAAWLVIALRVKRNRQLLDHLEKLPDSDRLKALQLEMGAVQVRAGLTADQWLRSRLQLYYFLSFCLVCVVAVVVFAIAMTTPMSRASGDTSRQPKQAEAADADITGNWHAAFTDADYAPGGNQFFFQLRSSGGRLFGTATRVYNPTSGQANGYPHAISDGRIEGKSISFWYLGETKHTDGDGNDTPLKDLFSGIVSGDTIRLTYQVDGGTHPVEFVATRIREPGAGKSP